MAPDDKLKAGDNLLHEFLADVETIRYTEREWQSGGS